MKTIIMKATALVILAFASSVIVFSQESSEQGEKEIIIIERTLDADGNEIGKKITRKRGSDMSDEELNKMLEQRNNYPFGAQSFRLSPRDNMFNSKPTIGVSLNFEGDRATVAEVMNGSGAAEADVRVGDHIVSVNDLPISVYEDIASALEGKKIGDRIRLLLVRDGDEIEKEIELRNNQFGKLGFNLPDGFGDGGFFFDFDNEGGLQLLTDSLMKNFFRNDFDFPNDGNWNNLFERNSDESEKEGRPQLGVFIEDVQEGVLITDVLDGSPADNAGLQEGDIIVRMNDEVITSYREISLVLKKKKVGDTLDVEVSREGKKRTLEVDLK